MHIVSDGVTASKPESMDLLLRNISRTAEAGENSSLIVLPEAAVVIKRSGTVGELDQLALDPALQPLREAAHSLDQNILVGVMWVVEGGSPRAGVILFRADRGVQVVDWNAHALGRGDGNMTCSHGGWGSAHYGVGVCRHAFGQTAQRHPRGGGALSAGTVGYVPAALPARRRCQLGRQGF